MPYVRPTQNRNRSIIFTSLFTTVNLTIATLILTLSATVSPISSICKNAIVTGYDLTKNF